MIEDTGKSVCAETRKRPALSVVYWLISDVSVCICSEAAATILVPDAKGSALKSRDIFGTLPTSEGLEVSSWLDGCSYDWDDSLEAAGKLLAVDQVTPTEGSRPEICASERLSLLRTGVCGESVPPGAFWIDSAENV